MNKKIILLYLTLNSIFCYSQNTIDFAFSPGLVLQEDLFIDANLFIGRIIEPEERDLPLLGYFGLRVGLESSFPANDKDYTIAPKIGFEVTPYLANLRLSAVNYFQNGKSEFRILPEIGLSIGGWVNLTYGYGIAFKDKNLKNISNHRFSVNFIVF